MFFGIYSNVNLLFRFKLRKRCYCHAFQETANIMEHTPTLSGLSRAIHSVIRIEYTTDSERQKKKSYIFSIMFGKKHAIQTRKPKTQMPNETVRNQPSSQHVIRNDNGV